MNSLSDRRILITGAASGMGEAIAELFLAHGARIALVDRDHAGLAKVALRLGVDGFVCDVTNEEQTWQKVGEAVTALGGLDGVVNAAGLVVHEPFEETDRNTWDRLIAVNLGGPFNIVKAALPALKKASTATIVNIASVSGLMPLPNSTAYAASKAGLIMFTKCLAVDLGPTIRANCIAPGAVETPMTRFIWEDPERLERAVTRVALKRIGQPGDIAQAALFLTSEASSFTTGSELVADGGFSWK